MKTKQGAYRSRHLNNVWYNPRKSSKTTSNMKGKKEIHRNGCHQNDRSNAKDTMKVKNDMKIGNGINRAKNCISEQN